MARTRAWLRCGRRPKCSSTGWRWLRRRAPTRKRMTRRIERVLLWYRPHHSIPKPITIPRSIHQPATKPAGPSIGCLPSSFASNLLLAITATAVEARYREQLVCGGEERERKRKREDN